ncbi:hypothetical protein HAX54_039820 [Datura stramonium]|uniref:Uncharacterized protein n=1 Tax=Datura stramonium TaxID=4076 RepID=A0ABS8VQ10_DATST|nr:hypothetical protein [Datura stramonium]
MNKEEKIGSLLAPGHYKVPPHDSCGVDILQHKPIFLRLILHFSLLGLLLKPLIFLLQDPLAFDALGVEASLKFSMCPPQSQTLSPYTCREYPSCPHFPFSRQAPLRVAGRTPDYEPLFLAPSEQSF